MVNVSWLKECSFRIVTDNGFELVADANNESAPCPTQILLSALGSCSATDVVEGLTEQGVVLESLSNELSYTLSKASPQLYESVNLHFKVRANNVSVAQVSLAADNAINKYCHVCLMLGPNITISHSVELVN